MQPRRSEVTPAVAPLHRTAAAPSSTMPEPTKLHLLTATQVLALLKQDTITVEDYARSLLGRINDRDSVVKAWAYLGKLPSSCHLAVDGACLLIPRQIRN